MKYTVKVDELCSCFIYKEKRCIMGQVCDLKSLKDYVYSDFMERRLDVIRNLDDVYRINFLNEAIMAGDEEAKKEAIEIFAKHGHQLEFVAGGQKEVVQ